MNPNTRSSAEQVLVALGMLFAVAIIASFVSWHWWHTQMSRTVISLQHQEMRAIGLFTNRYRNLDAQVLSTDPYVVKPMALWGLCTDVGRFFRIPVCLALAVLAVRCFFRASSGFFTRKLTLETLAVLQAHDFPVTKAYLGRDLKLVEPAEGQPRPLDPALHISEWIARYGRAGDMSFDEATAYAALQNQLGPRWQGIAKATPHVQCLVLGFWLHAQVRRQDALDVLSCLSTALQGVGMDGPAGPERHLTLPSGFGGEMRRLIGRTRDVSEVDVLLSGHAYTAPALMTLLTHARREAGVMNPGLFAGLKLVDRPLWWALQSLGFPQESGPFWRIMPAPCIEATAVLEHWQTECEADRALVVPAITSSLNRIRILALQTSPA